MQALTNEGFSLSPIQRRMWLQQVDAPASFATEANRLVLSIRGDLDRTQLKSAWQSVQSNQELLQTLFHRLPGEKLPLQVIDTELAMAWQEHDFANLCEQEQQKALANLTKPPPAFDHEKGPLSRVHFIQRTENSAWLILEASPLISDRTSMPLLAQYWFDTYDQNQIDDVYEEEEPIQYADITEWMIDALQGEESAPGRAFWRGHHAAPSRIADLSLINTAAAAACEHALRTLPVPQPLAIDLTLACWLVWLQRHLEQNLCCIGLELDGRSFEELAEAIGPFARQLPLQVDLAAGQTLADLENQISKKRVAITAHQDYYDWEQLGAPLFPIGFAVQPTLPDITSTHVRIDIETLNAMGEATSLKLIHAADHLVLHYDHNRFDDASITIISQQLLALFNAARQAPHQPIQSLSMLGQAERDALLVQFNATTQALPNLSVLERFLAHAAQKPEREVLQFDGLPFTYGDQEAERLNARELCYFVHHLAARLNMAGVQQDDLVAVMMDRSPEMIIAVLAIWHCGAAYLPISKDSPKARIAYLLEDAGATLVLSRQTMLEQLPASAPESLAIEIALEDNPAERQSPPLQTGNTAYLIYTSGSTGKPKGVCVTHHALGNYVNGVLERIQLPQGSTMGALATMAADLGHTALFGALAGGHRLRLLPEAENLDANALAERLEQNPLDFLKIVPSHFQALLSAEKPERLMPKQCLMFGGEALTASLVKQARELAPNCRIINHYGPTETTIGILSEAISSLPGSDTIPIGKPMANNQAYILNTFFQPVATGISGELYLGGQNLAQCYWQQPGLTAERFVPNPFAHDLGARLYRTGDRARFTIDGSVLFLGRRDDQVKVNGYRIETREVEQVLEDLPDIQRALVLPFQQNNGQKGLVGYIQSQDGDDPAQCEVWRHQLLTRIPEHMIPSKLIPLTRFPLNANGKVDRQALPNPNLWVNHGYVAPRNHVETLLCEHWCTLLGRDQVGIEDDFFNIGGHSLLATQAISYIRKALDTELPVTTLFDTPTVAQLAAKIRRKRQASTVSRPDIKAGDWQSPAPLSFAQQRLWFLDRLEGGSAVYNIPTAIRFKGYLDMDAMDSAFRQLTERQRILTVGLNDIDGQPVQQAGVHPWPKLVIIDLTDVEAEDRFLTALFSTFMQPMTITAEPLFRTKLIKLSETEYVLWTAIHHLITDGWSSSILVEELAALYEANLLNRPPILPPIPIQYMDYARWQRQWLTGDVLSTLSDYWREKLFPAPALLELPTDRPRQTARGASGTVHNFELTEKSSQQIHDMARDAGVTPFMFLLAIFKLCLHRHTSQTGIVVGTPVANRNLSEVEGLIGFFANMLPLYTAVRPDVLFGDLLVRVRQTTLAAYDHQDMPFELLVDMLQPTRSLEHAPIFQVWFSLRNEPQNSLLIPGLDSTFDAIVSNQVRSEFHLMFRETDTRFTAELEYSTVLYDAGSIKAFCNHFCTLLDNVLHHVQLPIGQLPIMDETTLSRQLAKFNDTVHHLDLHNHVIRRFEAQVKQRPEHEAVVFDEGSWSYDHLNRQANQLAAVLIARGVTAETRVALCLPRGPELISSLLGILKTGAAYVPLDPSHPVERLQYILADAEAKLVVTDPNGQAKLAAAQTILWDQSLDQAICDFPDIAINPQQLAYLIYTSGSTGQPKGVLVSHGALTNFLAAMATESELTSRDTLMAVTTISFDIAVLELFLPLICGARVRLMTTAQARDGLALSAVLKNEPITVLQATPATWHLLVEAGLPSKKPLRIWSGGEALNTALASRLQPHGAETWNLFGPTEATVWASLYRDRGEHANQAIVPIGQPLSNTTMYILDTYLNLLPQGVMGELYIGGIGLARGYWRRPALTAERFVPNPFSDQPGQRLYRSGDQARRLPDGTLIFLGRQDFQLKLRGFRIEAGEIENGLTEQTGVAQAVVTLCRSKQGADQLVAFIVPNSSVPEQARLMTTDLLMSLRDALQARLPDYMIPTLWVELPQLPRTPNGKVNRKALPDVSALESGPRQHTPPITPTEKALATIWQDLLKLDPVDAHDHFFHCGGHSLTALRLVARIGTKWQREVPVRLLFTHPTLRGFAKQIDAITSQDHAANRPIKAKSRPTKIPLSHGQQSLWLHDRMTGPNTAYNINTLVDIRGALSLSALCQAFEKIVVRHEILRTLFQDDHGLPYQSIQAPYQPVTILPQPADDEAAQQIAIDNLQESAKHHIFDLTTGPLFRVMVQPITSQHHQVLVQAHHIITDGWSQRLLLQEFVDHYRAAIDNEPAELGTLPLQYADYALWQRHWLSDKKLQAQVHHWCTHLEGAETLELPLDKPRPPAGFGRHREHILTAQLSCDASQAIRDLAQATGTTSFMVLLSTFYLSLHVWSGQRDLTLATVVSGRHQPVLENLVGYFVNQLLLRIKLDLQKSFHQMLHQVRDVVLTAFAQQDVPFGTIVHALGADREAGTHPLASVQFTYQADLTDNDLINSQNLQIEPLILSGNTAKSDIQFDVRDGEQMLFILHFDTDLFETAHMHRLLQQVQSVLSAAQAAPVISLADLLKPLRKKEMERRTNEAHDMLANQAQDLTHFKTRRRRGK